jgi:DNA-binding transcriptional LysR family regulator
MGDTSAVDPGPPLREIACFALVSRHLSFSRAAAELGMSQPAVSQAVARLERTLGVRLFERTSREVQLSDPGKVLLPYAEALLDQAGAFAAEAARLAAPAEQPIRLAYCPLVGAFAARVARQYSSQLGAPDLELRPAGWSTAAADLAQGVASAALMTAPFPSGMATTARFHVPVTHVAVPARSPLATASRVGLAQLTRVLLPRSRPPGSIWAAVAAGVRGEFVSADLDDLPAALDLVAAGRGALVAPHLLVEMVRRPDVRFVRLADPGLRMTYALVWRQEGASARLMALVQAVQRLLRNPARS